VVLTGYASVQSSIEAIKLGAVYLLAKPSSMAAILQAFDHTPTTEVRLDSHAKSGFQHLEQEVIQKVLKENQFNISKTALQLGIPRRSLQRKLKKLG
jgi:two-component system response regulator RegA